MIREITLADVFTHMGMDSARLLDVLEKYYKDKPDDHIVTIADHVKDRTKRFTVLELKQAGSDLSNRERSPKIPDAEYYDRWVKNNEMAINNSFADRIQSDMIPSLDVLVENKVCLQLSPNDVFHDPIDNTITAIATSCRAFEKYEDIDWSEIRILYQVFRKENDSKYYVQYMSHEKLEQWKKDNHYNPYGVSRVL